MGGEPLLTLGVVLNVMVLPLDLHEGHLATEELQGGEHLEALDGGHVGIDIAMEQEEGGVNLVGIEEGRTVNVQLAMAPRIASRHADLAIVVAPIALSPIAGVVGNAGMADGRGKEVGAGLQIHGHESAIGGTHATNLGGIDKGMLLTETARALDDVLGRTHSGGVDMARSPLLPEAGGPTGLEDVGHIAQRVPIVARIGQAEVARHGRTTSVVIDNEGVFLRRVEVGREVATTIDGVAPRAEEIPIGALSDAGIAQGGESVEELELLFLFEVHDIGRRGLHHTLGQIGHGGRLSGQ